MKTELIHGIPVIKRERLEFIERKAFEEQTESFVHLELLDEQDGGRVFHSTFQNSITIGRKKEYCNIAIDYDQSVSSKHCKLCLIDGNIYVSDLESTNGTYLNDQAVRGNTLIKDGDVLGIGRRSLKVKLAMAGKGISYETK